MLSSMIFRYITKGRFVASLSFCCLVLLFRIVGIVFVPLFEHLLPIDNFAVGNGFGLRNCLVVEFLFGMAQLHGFNGGVVKNMYSFATYAFIKVGRAKGFALYVEIGYIEFKNSSQCVAHHLLLCAVSMHLATQQLADNIYLPL